MVRDAKTSGKNFSTGCKSSLADSVEPPGEKDVLLMYYLDQDVGASRKSEVVPSEGEEGARMSGKTRQPGPAWWDFLM